jgi:RNA polymerase sigma-70 factor (ECF subfamily)
MQYDLSVTTSALLQGLHESGNEAAWRALDDRYRPILVATGRRFGLNEADAMEVAQETMLRVLEGCRNERYDRSKGKLRTWILTIARHRMIDLHRRRGVRREADGVSAIMEQPDAAMLDTCWQSEERAAVLRQAMERLDSSSKAAPSTIEAFRLHVLQGMPAQAVADQLNMSLNDVYLAKSRTTKRLKALVDEVDLHWNESA